MKKLVKEHINEISIEGSHLDRMNTGEKARIIRWLDEMRVLKYIINDDHTVDVIGNVFISHRNLTSIPVQFGKVTDMFSCSNNNLTSLKGCPSSVGTEFACDNNKLISIEGCPKKVGKNFYAHHNPNEDIFQNLREICDIKGNIFL
jgi:hypothetical protein